MKIDQSLVWSQKTYLYWNISCWVAIVSWLFYPVIAGGWILPISSWYPVDVTVIFMT